MGGIWEGKEEVAGRGMRGWEGEVGKGREERKEKEERKAIGREEERKKGCCKE